MDEEFDFERAGRKIDRKTEEALKAVFKCFTPSKCEVDGEKCRIKVFVEPKWCEATEDEEGYWWFGIDVKGENWHLEFEMQKSGWGSNPIEPLKLVEN